MDTNLRKLLRSLGLKWNQERLQAHLAPFKLGKCLAKTGRMALIYEAVGDSEAKVVVKVPRPPSADERLPTPMEDKVRALQHEARVLELVGGNPHVVSVVANRTAELLPFLVLERLGAPLQDVVDPDDSLDLQEALIMLRDAAMGLEAFHKRGQCHNDVKPDNVLSDPRGWVLIDPCPPDFYSNGYADSESWRGPWRDIVALGRTFLDAYLGVSGETDVPDDSDLEDVPEVVDLLKRMLRTSRYPVPDVAWVRMRAEQLLADILDGDASR